MATIGIDCRFASTTSGLGTYTRELVSALLRRDDPWTYVLFVRSTTEPWLPMLRSGRFDLVEAPVPHYSLLEQWRLPGIIRRAGVDLLFTPHFNVPLRCPVPFVCTIHDLILHSFPGEASVLTLLAYRLLMRHAIRSARQILTVSETTMIAIESAYGAETVQRTHVSYPGVGSEFSPRAPAEQEAVRRKCGLPEMFLLYVGNAKRHKNVRLLTEAFRRIRSLAPSLALVLVITGRASRTLELTAGVLVLPTVDRADLPALYSAAAGFVTASLSEGFGLPIVEAMACGCPVVAAACGSIPEVSGDGAILVPPTVEGLSDGVERLLREDLSALRERGQAHAQQFSWAKSAAGAAAVFAAALRHPS